MRSLFFPCATAVAVLGGAAVLSSACGGNSDATPNTSDASDASDAPAETLQQDEGVSDGSMVNCQLGDMTDPVAFCIQKLVLRSLRTAAFNKTTGVATSWSSVTGLPDTSDGGATLHDLHDDIGYGAACSLYVTSATLYGDNEVTMTLQGDLIDLAPIVLSELATLPDEYGGETYARLRLTAGGLRGITDTIDGDKVDAIADKYGRAIFTKYYAQLAALDGGAGDGGDAGDAGEDAADGGDASSDAEAGVPVPDGIIGRAQAGAYAYTTADVATAAVALLAIAVQNPTDADQAGWQVAAQGALDHLYNRARDATTGLYFRALLTSADPVHDQLDPSFTPSDALLTDVTATVALSLSRAQDLVNKNGSVLAVVANYPFGLHANDALQALNAMPSLYDGPANDAGATSTGFLEGYVPSTQTLLTSKATRANAFIAATIHRQILIGGTANAVWAAEVTPTRQTLFAQTPPNGSLLTVVPKQNAFLRAASKNFLPLTGDAGSDPYALSYQSAANIAFVEGMSEFLFMP